MRTIIILFFCSMGIAYAQDSTFLHPNKDFEKKFKCYFYNKFKIKSRPLDYNIQFSKRYNHFGSPSNYIRMEPSLPPGFGAYIYFSDSIFLFNSEISHITDTTESQTFINLKSEVGENWKCDFYFGKVPGRLYLIDKRIESSINDYIYKIGINGNSSITHVLEDFEEVWFSKNYGFLLIRFKYLEENFQEACISEELLNKVKAKDIIKALRSRKND